MRLGGHNVNSESVKKASITYKVKNPGDMEVPFSAMVGG